MPDHLSICQSATEMSHEQKDGLSWNVDTFMLLRGQNLISVMSNFPLHQQLSMMTKHSSSCRNMFNIYLGLPYALPQQDQIASITLLTWHNSQDNFFLLLTILSSWMSLQFWASNYYMMQKRKSKRNQREDTLQQISCLVWNWNWAQSIKSTSIRLNVHNKYDSYHCNEEQTNLKRILIIQKRLTYSCKWNKLIQYKK